MPLRPGEEPRLRPEEEQALIEKLRREREVKANALLQAAAQSLSNKMAQLDLGDIPAECKKLCSSEKALAHSAKDAYVSLMLNALLRSCAPKKEEGKGGGAKGKGGGSKKQANSIKAAAKADVEGEPPAGADVRKLLKTNKHILAEVTKDAAGQLALLKALQAWVLSPNGAKALEHTAKIIEVLYDVDQADQEVLMGFWDDIQANRAREAAELAETEAAFVTLSAAKTAAEEAVRVAESEKADAAWYRKQAENHAQAMRCGGNPSKEDEAAEKAALASLKKCVDLHNQTTKIAAARAKSLVEANAEFEPGLRLRDEQLHRKAVGVELFARHAAPFFEWLAASDDDSGSEEDD